MEIEKRPDGPSYSDLLDRAMDAQTDKNATDHFNELVEFKVKLGVSLLDARRIVKEDIGYHAGYGDEECRERFERLYECAHPVFGSIKENGRPTTAEAFELGTNLGSGVGPQTLSHLRKLRQQ